MRDIRKLLFITGVATVTPVIIQARDKLPNIVIFFMDDMGYGDLTITGASGYNTPTIDRLASEGMFFTHFYAAQPISSASRAGLITGCYPNRVGISEALMPQGRIGVAPNEETLPEILKTRGYSCGMVGKWHLGHLYPFLPLQQGFDEYLGLPYSNDMWPVDYDGNRVTPASNLPNKLRHPTLPLIKPSLLHYIRNGRSSLSKRIVNNHFFFTLLTRCHMFRLLYLTNLEARVNKVYMGMSCLR